MDRARPSSTVALQPATSSTEHATPSAALIDRWVRMTWWCRFLCCRCMYQPRLGPLGGAVNAKPKGLGIRSIFVHAGRHRPSRRRRAPGSPACRQTDVQPGFPADTSCEHTEMRVTGVNSRVGTTFGKYKITGLLGKGGMGEVYQAYDTAKGRTVALKILSDQFSRDETFRTRFLRESHAAAILQEPHVIPIHDWGEIDGSMYIDMRLVLGQALYDLIKLGALEPARALSVISQIASALDAAHDERLIHRDVKPQNIIVTPADFGYLVDFGIAEAKGDTRLTMTGTHIGSFAYMAPERFLDQGVTAAVDVYALACVLYEALTARSPFLSDSMEQVIAAHISSPPPRPSVVNPHVPASLDEVIARGMAKDPDDRYGSAGALGRAAQKALKADRRASPEPATMLGPPAVSPSLGQTWLPPRPE